MSRSGNHCIISWIMRQARGRICFLNCAEGKSNPLASARPLDSGAPYRVNYAGFDIERERAGAFSRKDYLIHSYEDSFLRHVCSDYFENHHDAFVGRSARRTDVIVLRDPFNLFASRRMIGAALTERTANMMWKQHAREFTDGPRYLKHDSILVNYNRWAACETYRRELAERLGLAFTDAGIDEVAPCGGGSSFDGFRFNGRAREMPLFERWKHFAADPAYLASFDPEMVLLAKRIFHGRPGGEALPLEVPATVNNACLLLEPRLARRPGSPPSARCPG